MPPDTNKSVQFQSSQINIDVENERNALDNAIAELSTVNTNIKFTESNDAIITQFLDSNNIDSPFSTEKFGIVTDVALIDSNNQKSISTNIFGISELPNTLSVVDEQGNPLDFGGNIQVTFDSITQSLPKSVTSWGTVKFFLDDRLLDTKKLWSTHNDIQKQSMSLVPNLIFESEDSFEFPIPPSFSEREKRNYTYNFSDENLPNGLHIFRVVFYDINAVIDSNNFNWKGENIVYELKFNIDDSLITKVSESGNGEKSTVFKSDGKFILNLSTIAEKCYSTPVRTDCIKTKPSDNVSPKIELLVDDKRIALVPKGTDSSSSLLPNVISTIPRGTNLKILIDDVVKYDEKTPLSQRNYELVCMPVVVDLSAPSYNIILNGQLVSLNILSSITVENRCTSSFGYEYTGEKYVLSLN